MESVGQTVVVQTVLYSVALLVAALTLAVILDLFGLRRLPRELRSYVYSTFLTGILGLMLASATGVLKTPDELKATVNQDVASKTADNIRLANDRAASIRPDTVSASPQPVPTPGQAATLFIQASTLDQKADATDLVAALGAAGVKAPGIEIVGARAPSTAEVRYFNEADKPTAEKIAAIARQSGVGDVKVMRILSYRSTPGQLEFWYARAPGLSDRLMPG